MRTFIIRPTQLISGGLNFIGAALPPVDFAGWYSPDYASILAAMLDYINPGGVFFLGAYCVADTGANALNDTLRFQSVGACIYLDGSAIPIAFSSLPSGFTPTSANIRMSQNGGLTNLVTESGSADYFLQQASGNNGPINTDVFAYNFSFPAPSMLDIQTNGMGLKVIISVGAPSPGPSFGQIGSTYGLFIEGTYDIVSTQFAIENPSPVRIGDEVRIVPSIVGAGGLSGVSSITITFNNGTQNITKTVIIDTHTDDLITFLIPSGLGFFVGPVPLTITLIGDGIQFSGSVILTAALQLLFFDGSGIYTLEIGKKSDTIYERTTVEVINSIPGEYVIDELTNEEEIDLINQFNTVNGIQGLLGLAGLLEVESDWEVNPYQLFYENITTVDIDTLDVKIPNPYGRTAFIGG